jgi:flagellin
MAAVTFSGFNNIDFGQVVSAIIAQERQPLAALESQQSTLRTQSTALGTLATSQLVNKKAAESRIRDANIAEESANLTRDNILTQSGIAALAQANSTSAAVLALLR